MSDTTLTTADALALHVRIAGDDGGPTVVVVHGLAGSVALSWDSFGVIDRLAAAGLRVVAFDLRGHGRSAAPAEPVWYEQSRLVADLCAVVDAFASPDAVVVGYSLGAALTLLALERGLEVRAVVLAGTAASALEWTEEDDRRRVATVEALRGSTDVDPDLVGTVAFFRMIGANLPALAGLFADHHPVVEDRSRITVPVTVVAGDADDVAAPPEVVAAELGGAPVVRVPGDHVTAVRSEEFAQAVVAVARGTS